MNKRSYRKNLTRPTLHGSMAMATGLALGALAGCSPHDAENLPGAQGKDSATVNQPLLGMDGIAAVALPNVVINKYSKVMTDVAAGAKTVTVADASKATGLDVGAGDLVMIIQMQGAEIKTDDDPAVYGTINNLNNAGKYELATVTSVTGNAITVDACGGLKNSYTAAKHAQVVKVPQYKSLTVAVTGSITAPAWNGDTGGVVAAYVQGATTLTGPIDVTGTGFRGGAVEDMTNSNTLATTITRSKLPADGAEQGESVAGTQDDYQNAQGKYGRGAPANGGGGGNSHNGGGGGGANASNAKTWTGAGVMDGNVLGADAWKVDPEYIANAKKLTDSSGGGRGGYTYASSDQDALTVGPDNAVWGGNNRANVGGRGGRPLDASPTGRLFLGGGGGAGDGNNGAATAGANGGGMVFLVTGSLTGGPILANGASAKTTLNGGGKTGNDAPGGGGGGGTVVVLAGQAITTTAIKADGGLGGNQDINNGDESEGPGGGGGGGIIATYAGNYTGVTRTAGGGASGTSNSPAVTEFPVNGATKGAAGISDMLLKFSDASALPICIPSDVAVTAVKANGTVQGGSTISLTVTVKNTGPQPSDVTNITDSYNATVPGVTWTCVAAGGAVCPAASGTGSIGGKANIPASGMLTYTVNVPIPVNFPQSNLVYTAAAGVSPGFSDPNLANNTVTLTLPMPAADLSLAVTATPTPATPGQPVTYDLVVTNNGPGTAGSASLQYTVPPGGVVAGIVPGLGWICQQVASTVTCDYAAQVPPGALPDVKINVVPLGGMDLVAQSSVTGTASTDPSPENNSVTTTTPVATAPGADISVGLNSTPNPAEKGAPIKYAVRVSNNGPNSASGASFQLTLPQGASPPTIDAPAGWSCQQVVNNINCVFGGAVPQGTLPEVDVTYQPDTDASSVTAIAQALGIGVMDPNLGNNQVQEVTPIGLATAPQADLTLTVTTSPDKPVANMPIVYTIDVANHGPGTATGAVVSYTIPPGGTVQGIDSPAGWNCAQQDRNVSCWYNGNIDPNTSAPDIHITVLPPQDATSIDVQVSATPKGAVDPNTSDNSVDVNTDLGAGGAYKLAGGGFGLGCSAVPTGAAQPGAALGFLGSLLGLLGLRRRRRS